MNPQPGEMPMAGEPLRMSPTCRGLLPRQHHHGMVAACREVGRARVGPGQRPLFECAFDIAVVTSRQEGTHHIDNIDMSILYIYT